MEAFQALNLPAQEATPCKPFKPTPPIDSRGQEYIRLSLQDGETAISILNRASPSNKHAVMLALQDLGVYERGE